MKPLALLAALILVGCASTGPDGGFDEVGQAVSSRTGAQTKWIRSATDANAARDRVKALLAKPLVAEDAVQIALVNNPGLQASYAELGVAAGDLLSTVLPNPRLSYLRARHEDEYKIETILSFNILSLITVPMAMQAQKYRFAQAKLIAAEAALRIAAETRKAYFRALAAQQSATYMQDVKAAAEASAELASRMAAVGNFSKLDRMRQQAFYAEATAQLARASQQAVAERERLTRLLGLWGEETQFKLPERMPELPKAPRELPNAERLAMEQRLDVQAARQEAESLASSLGLTRVTRFVSEFELGIARVREDPEPTKKGYEIGVPIPLFDWGGGRVARAEALYMQAANRIAETAINARSEVRESYLGYRTAYDVAKHYRDEVVPVRKQISDEMVLRYNGMLSSVFELLVDAREQVAAVSAYIDALSEFWLADTDLQNSLTGASSGAAGGGAPRMQRAGGSTSAAGGH
jgi:outer membrane protein TolC